MRFAYCALRAESCGEPMKKLIAIALAFVTTSVAGAQTYPARPVTVVVPYPAGGPTDTLARILADHMRTSLGQSIIVENVTGGGGSIGVGRVARGSRRLHRQHRPLEHDAAAP